MDSYDFGENGSIYWYNLDIENRQRIIACTESFPFWPSSKSALDMQ